MEVVAREFAGLKAWILTPENCHGYCLFVHGGPGSHCHYFKQFVLNSPSYNSSGLGWVVYDQRGCGESLLGENLHHKLNVSDLKKVYKEVRNELGEKLAASVGHSYGAWVLYDAAVSDTKLFLNPSVLIGLARDRMLPRTRNFIMELLCSKTENPKPYNEFLETLPELALEDPWKQKDLLREIVGTAQSRSQFYWSNLNVMQQYSDIKVEVAKPENDEVFRLVRDTVYEERVEEVDVSRLAQKSIRFIGFQDWMMGGEQEVGREGVKVFLKSGHYPHLEQPEAFIENLKEVIKK